MYVLDSQDIGHPLASSLCLSLSLGYSFNAGNVFLNFKIFFVMITLAT